MATRIRPDPDGDEAAWDAYLADVRWRIQSFMVVAGLTELQRRVYWLRVGELRTWREIARELWPRRRGRAVLTREARTHYTRAERRLSWLVCAMRMTASPLYRARQEGDTVSAREDALHALGTLILQAGAEPPDPDDDAHAVHPFAAEPLDDAHVRRLCRVAGADYSEVSGCIDAAVERYSAAWAQYHMDTPPALSMAQ